MHRETGKHRCLAASCLMQRECVGTASEQPYQELLFCNPKGNGRSARNCRQSKRKPAEYSGGRMCAVCQCAGTARIIDKSGIAKLEKKQDVGLALLILFQLGDASKPCKDDKRNISVFFDTDAYDTYDMYAASREFTAYLNTAFLQAERIVTSNTTEDGLIDSFGQIYVPTNSPMPKVKLAAGFEPALYTMFDGQPCQNRYHNFDDKRDSYPLSAQHRVQFQASLNWLGGDAKNKGITWLNTGKGEAVFAYPSSLPEAPLPYVQFLVILIDRKPSRNLRKPFGCIQRDSAKGQT